MDPMCYLPVQRIPGNYRRKKNQKGTKRRQQPKTPQTEVVGVLSCAMRKSSFKFSGEIPGFKTGTGIIHKSLGSLKSFKEKRKEKTSTVFEFNTKVHPISES